MRRRASSVPTWPGSPAVLDKIRATERPHTAIEAMRAVLILGQYTFATIVRELVGDALRHASRHQPSPAPCA